VFNIDINKKGSILKDNVTVKTMLKIQLFKMFRNCILKHITFILNSYNVSHCNSFCFGYINAALVITSDFFQKYLKNLTNPKLLNGC